MRLPKSVEGSWQGRMMGLRSSGMDNDKIRTTDSSNIEDQEDRHSGVPEYLWTKTAGLRLVKDALKRILE